MVTSNSPATHGAVKPFVWPRSMGSSIVWILVVLGALVAFGPGLRAAPTAPSPIHIRNGWVQGTSQDGLTAYLGIPFAAPPVGALRWRAPQPAADWPGVLHADTFAASPMQHLEAWMGPLHASEDCLYLNVWTPATSPKQALPVMVWIYGGGFTSGSTAMSSYSGAELAKHGVVVVSIAYRVGPMGFLALPSLSAESSHHVSGNYGLLDQIAGLKWIRDNIAAFGGDPHRVTIFGESAGGISVSMLAASPLAHGLFQGAISESGGSMGPTRTPPAPGENVQTLAAAEQQGLAFMKRLGVSSLEDLRKLPASAIQNAAGGPGEFWPVQDGYVITSDPYLLYQQGRFNDTPVLIGTNSDEGALFGTPPSEAAYVASVRGRFGPFADRILARYPATPDAWRQSSLDLMRDSAFAWGTWSWARLQAEHGKGKAYVYYFAHVPPRSPQLYWKKAIGAVHSEEMVYVFQHLNQSPDLPWSAADRTLSDDMATYWTNFVKTGNPNGPGLPEWPAFTTSGSKVMHFTDAPTVGGVANLKDLETLDAYFAWRRTPEGEAWAKRQK